MVEDDFKSDRLTKRPEGRQVEVVQVGEVKASPRRTAVRFHVGDFDRNHATGSQPAHQLRQRTPRIDEVFRDMKESDRLETAGSKAGLGPVRRNHREAEGFTRPT